MGGLRTGRFLLPFPTGGCCSIRVIPPQTSGPAVTTEVVPDHWTQSACCASVSVWSSKIHEQPLVAKSPTRFSRPFDAHRLTLLRSLLSLSNITYLRPQSSTEICKKYHFSSQGEVHLPTIPGCGETVGFRAESLQFLEFQVLRDGSGCAQETGSTLWSRRILWKCSRQPSDTATTLVLPSPLR